MKFLSVLFSALILAPSVQSNAVDCADCVQDLIAGGGNANSATIVGDVRACYVAGSLFQVTYNVNEDGWCLFETHLAVEATEETIPQTKKGNPIPGQFEYSMDHSCTYEATYFLDGTDNCPTDIAAHAVVGLLVGEAADLDGLEENLPDQVTMIIKHGGGDSYFDVEIVGGSLTGTYDDWCIDTDLVINYNTEYTANVYSSYEEIPEGLLEFPLNLDLVNHIINQDWVGEISGCPCNDGSDYTYSDVQRAIWELIEGPEGQSTAGLGSWCQCRVDEILNLAMAEGEGFVPDCYGKVAVILVPVGEPRQTTIAQVTFGEVPVAPCIPTYDFETAWASGTEFNADHGWATDFTCDCPQGP